MILRATILVLAGALIVLSLGDLLLDWPSLPSKATVPLLILLAGLSLLSERRRIRPPRRGERKQSERRT